MFCEGPSFWRTIKRNIEEAGEIFFTISPKMMFVDSDASKDSQDEGTKAKNPSLTGPMRLATGSRESYLIAYSQDIS